MVIKKRCSCEWDPRMEWLGMAEIDVWWLLLDNIEGFILEVRAFMVTLVVSRDVDVIFCVSQGSHLLLFSFYTFLHLYVYPNQSSRLSACPYVRSIQKLTPFPRKSFASCRYSAFPRPLTVEQKKSPTTYHLIFPDTRSHNLLENYFRIANPIWLSADPPVTSLQVPQKNFMIISR